MTRSNAPLTRRPGADPVPSAGPPRAIAGVIRHERAGVIALIALHAALVLWGVTRNSVTFDENYHLPSGVLIVARHDFRVSTVNPPLVKALCAVPALMAGARLPADSAIATENQQMVGYSFMRANAARYHDLFMAARLPVLLLSLALALLVWRWARRLYGRAGGLVALAAYALAPESLAHAGVVGMDLATGLGFAATLYGWWGFARSGRWPWFACSAAGFAFTLLTRFTGWSLLPILAIVTLVTHARRPTPAPARLWVGLALLVPIGFVALAAGYLGQVSFAPLRAYSWHSHLFQTLTGRAPWLRLPVPDSYLRGFDWQAHESDAGNTPTFVLGQLTTARVWWYFPLALLVKWPIGFLGALLARLVTARARRSPRRRDDAFLLMPAALLLLAGMTLVKLNAGMRYMFPLLPLLAVWLGGLAAPETPGWLRAHKRVRSWRMTRVAAALAAITLIESLVTAPYYLSSFNLLAGGPGRGDAIVNDSNVDWGQGLIALRDELARRGIRRVYLTYHGTVDPAVYGIDYVPYAGGPPGSESEWLAVSSYFYNGLRQRMVTRYGVSEPVSVDFRGLWDRAPDARPANCMYLYHVGGGAAP
jgi:Dolichyl-phosphate-mannose-protein mannosyltransferase